MSQITLYLDEVTQSIVEHCAKVNGVSKSRWVTDLIRQYAPQGWSKECLALAGQFPDFPLREDNFSPQGVDVPRIGF